MRAFTFLRNGTRAADLKEKWRKDQPLTIQEGGSAAPLEQPSQEKAQNLREGGKLIGGGCLTFLASQFSYEGLQYSRGADIKTALPRKGHPCKFGFQVAGTRRTLVTLCYACCSL